MKLRFLLVAVFVLLGFTANLGFAEECNLKIGVTLHPYYSWVKNIVGDTAEVSPVIPPESDPHTYQPMASDIAKLEKINILIVNGQGHDGYINQMLKAVDRKDLIIHDTSKGLPLIPTFGHTYSFDKDNSAQPKISYNSHTYIAITGAIQQIQGIARELGKLCPDNAKLYKKNARDYAKRLRVMLSDALDKIDKVDTNKLRIATVHDGYSYLFQELGIEVAAVVQPRHGIEPNARQLQDTIKRIKKAKADILFTELDYQKKYVDIIFQETGCRIYSLSHISNGEYTADKFEKDIQKNLDEIIKALTESQK